MRSQHRHFAVRLSICAATQIDRRDVHRSVKTSVKEEG